MIEKEGGHRGSQARKRRGRETERLVAAAFVADGWPYALPTGAGTPGIDITGLPGLAVEVKARSRFDPMANLRQAAANAGGALPMVVMRPNGCGPASIDEWPVFVPFAVMRRLLKEAGYAEGQKAQ